VLFRKKDKVKKEKNKEKNCKKRQEKEREGVEQDPKFQLDIKNTEVVCLCCLSFNSGARSCYFFLSRTHLGWHQLDFSTSPSCLPHLELHHKPS
jgi:hypothetical protein